MCQQKKRAIQTQNEHSQMQAISKSRTLARAEQRRAHGPAMIAKRPMPGTSDGSRCVLPPFFVLRFTQSSTSFVLVYARNKQKNECKSLKRSARRRDTQQAHCMTYQAQEEKPVEATKRDRETTLTRDRESTSWADPARTGIATECQRFKRRVSACLALIRLAEESSNRLRNMDAQEISQKADCNFKQFQAQQLVKSRTALQHRRIANSQFTFSPRCAM